MIILFDLDGTLIDSTQAILESFGVAFDTFNTPKPNDEEIKKLIGEPLDVMFMKLGVDEADKYVNAYKQHYRKISTQKTKLLPFAKEAIIKASKIAKLGIVTTKTARYSQELMEYFGVMQYFEILIGRENVDNPKPHPEPILKALKRLDYQNHRVYMIGDTCLDCISAKNANVNSIGVHSGYGDLKDLKSCCEIVLENSLKAIEWIERN